MTIHFIGKREFPENGHPLLRSACRAVDERMAAISAFPDDVDCNQCIKHGLFKHAVARNSGLEPPTPKRLFDEYEQLLTLSSEDKKRLEHYQKWHWIKAMSMVRLQIGHESDVYWLERNKYQWAEVTALLNKGKVACCRFHGH